MLTNYSVCDGVATQEKVSLFDYSEDYWLNYINLEHTDIAIKLNILRYSLVEKHCTGDILDIGIGSGEFIKKVRLKAYGYDINPFATQWLKTRNLFLNPYEDDLSNICAYTMWDVIEHMIDPMPLLNKINGLLFTSMPIFSDFDNLIVSKHYKENEHIRYFTFDGLIQFMEFAGFCLIEHNKSENTVGRDGIGTFVFQK